ncbi:HutD/Ves family protein [Rhizobium sp. RAF56]|jgi:environmental stress-induced protein Ves|uniref:HutD/Ves family protein n=1 Tax=Rhizobium sp. RAF56 TaxID=3233062 RepID=UPI003F95C06C
MGNPLVTILRAKDYRRMPWKNGGGETVEIAVFPEGAGLAEFEWRISMATVAADGPFSVFPEIDRTLSIIDGAGMTLAIDGREPVLLTQDSEPLPFAADAPTSATLVKGAITDLNVMTRRGAHRHSVARAVADNRRTIELTTATTLILCDGSRLDVTGAELNASLAARDCLVIHGHCQVVLSGEGRYFVIAIEQV